MDITTTVRTFLLAATIAATGMATTACGEEVKPPSQNIGVQLPEPEVKHFEPACNTRAAVRPCPSDMPTGSGTRNRMRFDDELEPQR
jgi:hypothetical protein